MISGGGTGGHIYPAIAIADELSTRIENNKVLFVGSSNRMEMQKVPDHGYDIIGLWISGIKRKLYFSITKPCRYQFEAGVFNQERLLYCT